MYRTERHLRLGIVGLAALGFALLGLMVEPARADSRGDELALWLNQRGEQVWGPPPAPCDDLTFARRLYFDILGRSPSVAEIHDFEQLSFKTRRQALIEQLVFGEGPRQTTYRRQASIQFARQWRQVLLPNVGGMSGAQSIESWLGNEYREQTPFDEIMRRLVSGPSSTPAAAANVNASAATAASQYYQLLGALPENYAGNMSRVMLGVRIECAQCHDHPFTAWKMRDFWGLAAFYSELGQPAGADASSPTSAGPGTITFQGVSYPAKLLWSNEPFDATDRTLRIRLARWMTAEENPNFAATAANRFWQHLIGRGLVPDVENLDQASADERRMLDEFGKRFAEDGFHVQRLMAAICKSNWYQAISEPESLSSDDFYRPLKAVSPEQVFDAMEQALHLPISSLDPQAARWTGGRVQLISRLSESSGRTPDEYSAGIPQALLLMNGQMTEEAASLEKSRLLRAVVDNPFMGTDERIETFYLSLITRRPTPEEVLGIHRFLESKPNDAARKAAMGEIVWALLNSPEFVLCR